MISAHVKNHLSDFLRGTRSADDSRQILALIDQAQGVEAQGNESHSLVNEFDRLLEDLASKIPGLALDFEKLLSGDEIESDPLISQGNLAILRLDVLYHQTFEAWTESGGDLHKIKSITKAEDPSTYAQRTERHERTEENRPPDTRLINQLINLTLSAFRIQATITDRREQLKNHDKASGGRKSPEFYTSKHEAPTKQNFKSQKICSDERFASLRGYGPHKGFGPLSGFCACSGHSPTPLNPPSEAASPRKTTKGPTGPATTNLPSALSAPPREKERTSSVGANNHSSKPVPANEPAYHKRE